MNRRALEQLHVYFAGVKQRSRGRRIPGFHCRFALFDGSAVTGMVTTSEAGTLFRAAADASSR
jgi:hypothetical protein